MYSDVSGKSKCRIVFYYGYLYDYNDQMQYIGYLLKVYPSKAQIFIAHLSACPSVCLSVTASQLFDSFKQEILNFQSSAFEYEFSKYVENLKCQSLFKIK